MSKNFFGNAGRLLLLSILFLLVTGANGHPPAIFAAESPVTENAGAGHTHSHSGGNHDAHEDEAQNHGDHDYAQAPGTHGYEEGGNLHEHFHDESAKVSHDVYYGEPWRIDGSVGWMRKKVLWLGAFSLAVWIFLKIRTAPRRKKEAK